MVIERDERLRIFAAPKVRHHGDFRGDVDFQPAMLPPLSAAKGHPYFIYHSPQDFIPSRSRKQPATPSKRQVPSSSFRLTRAATAGKATSSVTSARELTG